MHHALALVAALTSPAAAAAQDSTLRFDARLVPATGVLAGTLVLGLAPQAFASRFPLATCAPCDASRLWGIDRGAVGPVRAGPNLASDVTLLSTAGGAGLLLLLDAAHDGERAREDLTVFAQALATATVLSDWTKVLVHRPRPYRYDPAAVGAPTTESSLSFPSGHTTAAFAAASAFWSIEARRGRAGAQRARIAALLSSAVATGVLRVVAREHFPTDVAAGAVLGAAIGWSVPRLYPVRRPSAP